MAINLFFSIVDLKGQIIYNPNDDRYRKLALEKAIWTYQENYDQYVRAKKMYKSDLISKAELTRIESSCKISEIELKQALLALTQEAPYLIIEEAISQRDISGQTKLEIKLRNIAKIPESPKLDTLLKDVSQEIGLNDLIILRNVIVSLKKDNTIIALPYEQKVDSILPNHSQKLTFTLLEDIETVSICLNYSGVSETKDVYIQRNTGSTALQLRAIPLAQIAEFGSTINYELDFERSKTDISSFNLEIIGLPDYFTYRFIDNTNQVSKLIFPPTSLKHELLLEISMPDRSQAMQLVDSTIRFDVISKIEGDNKIQSEINLELIPTGRGEITLYSRNWKISGTIETPPVLELEVRNTGTIEMQDVRWDIVVPGGWQAIPNPQNFNRLSPGSTKMAEIALEIPEDEFQGEFEVDVSIYSFIKGKRIDSGIKTFRIVLSAKRNLLSILILVFIGLVLIFSVFWFGKKFSRR